MWIRKRGELYTGTAWADCTSILCRNARKESDWMAIHLAIRPSKSNTFKREQATAYNLSYLEGDYRGWQADASHPKSLTSWERKRVLRKRRGVRQSSSLENKAGSIPQSAVESLARTLLPQMQAFFESEQGKQTLKEWHEERERHS